MRRWFLPGAVAVLVTLASPVQAQFCPGVSPWVFDDVAASDPFCGYITWMAQNGITLGCQTIDANHRLYCPNATVTRAAMAAFMNRLGNVRVEAVGTGPGLTGGPITGIGTINLAATNLLPTTACATNQIARWNGSAWVCSSDANSGGTVTSVATGAGLTGGPITSSGTLSIAAGYQLPQSCTNGQIPKSNGAGGWTCAADANSGGTVTSVTAGAGLTGGTITTTGTIAVDPASTTLTSNFFRRGGNAFVGAATLGTTNNAEVDVVANNALVLRLHPGGGTSPNVIGGHANNAVVASFNGQAIGGGGMAGTNCWDPIALTATRTCGNVANGDFATVAGGKANTSATLDFVGGGDSNVASGGRSAVAGGFGNVASGLFSAVAGGGDNTASGAYSSVLGGNRNTASGTTSVAAGFHANADRLNCFVFGGWSDNAAFPNCLGSSYVVRFMVDHGFSVDYYSARPDGGGNRWVYIGDLFAGETIRAWNGARLTDAGVWLDANSASHTKTDFEAVDAGAVLREVVRMPITTWRYKEGEAGVRHMGPMAEDFWAAFGVGYGPQTIANLDARGVAFAAIQGLNAKLEAKVAEQAREIAGEREIRTVQAREIEAARHEIAELKRVVEVLLARTSPEDRMAAR